MNDRETLAVIGELRHLDEQTVKLYDTAIGKVQERQLTDQLQQFRADHERHVRELGDQMVRMGRKPVGPTEDFRKFLAKELEMLQQASDEAEVMRLLVLAEESAAAEYANTMQHDLPKDVSQLLTKNHDDEVRHVQYVEAHVPVGAGVSGRHDVACMTGGMTDDINPDDFE